MAFLHFPPNLGDVSDEDGERFHQNIKVMESGYKTKLKSDNRLFQAIIREPYHVLRNLLPPTRNSGHKLRAGRIISPYLRKTIAITFPASCIRTPIDLDYTTPVEAPNHL